MNKIAVVDIETTGFQKDGGLIVEIGIVGLNLDNGKINYEMDVVVREKGFSKKHTQNPYGWIFNNSTLTYDRVKEGYDLKKIIPQIQEILDKYPTGTTAYNKSFDFGFLKSRGVKIKELPCIMLSATPVVDLPSNFGYSEPKWPTVEEAWQHFFPNKKYKEAHRALDDATHEALICLELQKMNRFLGK